MFAGGPAPLIATWLLSQYHSGYAIAGFILVCALISLASTAMLPDFWIAELAPNRQHRSVRSFLVGTHQTRIAGDIDRQDGGQPSFNPRFVHLGSQSQRETAAQNMMERRPTRASVQGAT